MLMLVSTVAGERDALGPGVRRRYPRCMRLLRHADFERVYQQGRRHFSAHMTVFYAPRQAGEGVRVGYTVSRALAGAVERNRMKRRLREVVRLTRPQTGVPVDIVINPKKSLQQAEFNNLMNEMRRAFEIIQQSMASGRTSR